MSLRNDLTGTNILVILIMSADVGSMAVPSYSYSSYVADAIEKDMIEEHGVRMWTQNNADDKGATFTLTFRSE